MSQFQTHIHEELQWNKTVSSKILQVNVAYAMEDLQTATANVLPTLRCSGFDRRRVETTAASSMPLSSAAVDRPDFSPEVETTYCSSLCGRRCSSLRCCCCCCCCADCLCCAGVVVAAAGFDVAGVPCVSCGFAAAVPSPVVAVILYLMLNHLKVVSLFA